MRHEVVSLFSWRPSLRRGSFLADSCGRGRAEQLAVRAQFLSAAKDRVLCRVSW
jgi:hypothetical protein